MPTAVEELLRAYAPVTMARLIVEETEVGGCTFKAGEMVMLPFPAANRDPEVFPDADKVILDRVENRHMAFGVGIHRCLGLQPGPDGAPSRARRVAPAHPQLHARRSGRGHLVAGHRARSATAAGHVRPLTPMPTDDHDRTPRF